MVVEIEGKKYYPLYQFASMTCRSMSAIRHLMFTGNRIRKLRFVEEPPAAGRYFIPVEEYTDFPFTSSGRFSTDNVFHYTEDGEYIQYSEEELIQIYNSLGKEYIARKKES